MKLNRILFNCLLASVVLVGCTSELQDQRTQLLQAQYESIASIEREMQKMRDGNGANMEKWEPVILDVYKAWQSELSERYKEREKLIKGFSIKTEL